MNKKHESGWALLFVFMLAASIAIMLYMALPRVAFESQRAKEQLLIDRGEQYSMAIRRYYTKLGKYPAKMEDLEDTNGRHYLRHRYKDPLTGKDDWRIIHIGPMGQLTDSKLQPAPASPTGQSPSGQPFGGQQSGQGTATASTGFGTTTTSQTASEQADAQPVVNMAAIRRPSDRGTAPTPPGQGATDQENPDQNADANPPQDEQNPADQANPVEPNVPGDNPAENGVPGQGANRRNGDFVPPNVVPPNGIPVNGASNNPPANNPGMPVYPQGQNPGQSVPGMFRPAQQNQSTTTQGGSTGTNPGVPAAVTSQIFGSNPQGQTQAGTGASPFGNNSLGTTGIAGVASTFNAEGIMRYKDQSKYVKWEFVFTPNSGAGTPGQSPNVNPLNPQQNQQNQPQSPFAPSNTNSGTTSP